MSNQCVSLFTDNAALVDIINKQTSKHPMIMILVRDLVLTSLRHNILFRAYHIPGVDNTRADLISRLQIVHFRKEKVRLYRVLERPNTGKKGYNQA